jgi:hypothetical protein
VIASIAEFLNRAHCSRSPVWSTQSSWRVRTAVLVGNGDFSGHAAAEMTTCSAFRCGISECKFTRESADRFVISTGSRLLKVITSSAHHSRPISRKVTLSASPCVSSASTVRRPLSGALRLASLILYVFTSGTF